MSPRSLRIYTTVWIEYTHLNNNFISQQSLQIDATVWIEYTRLNNNITTANMDLHPTVTWIAQDKQKCHYFHSEMIESIFKLIVFNR